MKKLQLVAAIMTLFICGCSEQMNPVEPIQTPGDAPDIGKASTCIVLQDDMIAAGNLVSTSSRLLAKQGGSVVLQGTFIGANGSLVTYKASIFFPANALPADTTISITIDKATFQENAEVTFGPHGLIFDKPGILSLQASGAAIAEDMTGLKFIYWNKDTWEEMPNSWGVFVANDKGILAAGAKVPHFSRYAFGR